ncbi:hypothetical protein M9H77_14264 [Catharanthus roseus]|uniref:Uncharacterized protein n=1 Tax=Catharanthus roseus TaxID=4058 RepID=A0ACC0BML1_CATRO|nr:hypothetical protein M9H77_14264 [Catharanthus roseus]
MEEVPVHVHPGPIVLDAVMHGSFGGCTTNRGSLSHSTDLGMVAYTCIAASADDGYSGRPSCSSWCYMFVGLPYHDRGLVLSDLWRAETFPVQPSRRHPQEHVPDWGALGVKRGARRQPGRGAGDGRPPVPPFHRHVEMERSEGSGQVERGEGSGGGHPLVDPFDSPNLDMPSFSLV